MNFLFLIAMSEVANSINEATAVVIVTKSKIILCGIKYITTSANIASRVTLPKVVIRLLNFVRYLLKINGEIKRFHKIQLEETT